MSARLLFILIISVCMTSWPLGADADPVGDLYAAQVPVRDQSTGARGAALRDAMAQILVKVTGSRAVLESVDGKALLENPSRYLQQYRYESVQPIPADPAAPRLVLRAEFDGNALEQRLRAAGVSLWGRERPMTLVWLALSTNADRQLLGSETASPVTDALDDAAVRRGLPVKLPTLDREDATRVSFMDVWGVFEEPLLAAAERYAPDAVLAGSIFDAGNALWAGRFTLLRDDQRHRWELSGPTPEAVAAAMMDALAEHYANEFSAYALDEGQGKVTIEVSGVNHLRDYARVQSYLGDLSVVDDAHLLGIDNDTLRFELDLNGTRRGLEQSIALGRLLEPLPVSDTVIHLGTNPAQSANPTPESGAAAPVTVLEPVQPALRYRLRK